MKNYHARIALVRPTFGSMFQITPPLSLGYIASSLKKKGYQDISIIDGTLAQLSPESMLRLISERRPAIIGIQVYTGSHNWTRNFVKMLKKSTISAEVVVGGPHISALKEKAIEHIGADYGIVGEGEESFAKLVEVILDDGSKASADALRDIPGLIYKDEEGRFRQSIVPFARIPDLDTLPFPDYELLHITKYFKHMQGATVPLRGKRPVPILTSRGCPFNCTFCSSSLTFLKKMRFRSVQSVVEELEYLKNRYHIDEFFITDDNLTLDMKRAEEFFDLLVKKRLNLHWRAPNGLRADRLDKNLIRKMKRSGCYFVGIGVETGSQRIMKTIKKSLDLRKIDEVLPILRRQHIITSGFFMVGMKEEKDEDIMKTIKFIRKSKFDRIQVSIYTPYPGSQDFDDMFEAQDPDRYGKNVEDYLYKGIIPPINPYVSYDNIHKYQKRMLKTFYMKPRVIIDLILNLKLSQIDAILKHPSIRRWFKSDHASYLDDIR